MNLRPPRRRCRTSSRSTTTRRAAIAHELYRATEKLGAPMQLLALVGSYGDTLPDEAVLTYLRVYNETGTYTEGFHHNCAR
jgi:hypothetical protein